MLHDVAPCADMERDPTPLADADRCAALLVDGVFTLLLFALSNKMPASKKLSPQGGGYVGEANDGRLAIDGVSKDGACAGVANDGRLAIDDVSHGVLVLVIRLVENADC